MWHRLMSYVCYAAPAPSTNGGAGLIQDFVARSGTRFVVQSRDGEQDSCETFYFAGANTYYLVRPRLCTDMPCVLMSQEHCHA